ncbi:MAG: tyrosine/phenylalanine carboxypeptidase domain-containing protein [Acidimicrobiia bacterium]
MSVDDVDLALDRRLSEICGLLPMLRLLTPTNVPDMAGAYLAGETDDPEFTYADLPDLDAMARELEQVNPEEASDPVLIHMMRGMHRELERRLELLESRNTEHFLLAAVEKYGHVEKTLLDLAHQILEEIPPGRRSREFVASERLATLANRELDHYRALFPELTALVHISDTAAGVMVENGDLFIGADTTIAVGRVEQLLQHEIGIHVLTYVNGSAQPIRMLSLGLAGYEETQESLGVLAEHLSGGLRPQRLRVLALRVVAAQSVSDRARFADTYDLLRKHGSGRHLAFMTTMRAHRSGGMTKDALYLGGLIRLLAYLHEGGRFDSLLVGKISLEDEPLVVDLLDRGVLVEPPLRPRFMDSEMARDRLTRIRDGASVMELGGVVV